MVKYSQTTEKKGSVEMKGIRAAVLALGGAFLLAGCGGESGVLAPIPAEGFSQGVYDALEENWTAWEGGRVGTHAEQHTSGPLRPGV